MEGKMKKRIAHDPTFQKGILHWILISGILVIAGAFVTACEPTHRTAREVDTTPPKVSYKYSSDEGLVEANAKARTYCSQYAATPSIRGSVTSNSDGSKTATFECVKTAAVVNPPVMAAPAPAPAPAPRGYYNYSYRSDTELMQAIQSADSYCARTGQIASTSIVTNTDGTKTLTYQCVPR
jgi:hypothetical protein